MKRSHDLLYDKTSICVLSGTIEVTDGSFNHAFGTEKREVYELVDFAVYVTVLGDEKNITDKFSEKTIEMMKADLLRDYIESQNDGIGAEL